MPRNCGIRVRVFYSRRVVRGISAGYSPNLLPCTIRIALYCFDRPRTGIFDNVSKTQRACPMLSIYCGSKNVAEIISVNVFLPDCCLMHKAAADVDYDVVRKLPQRIRG